MIENIRSLVSDKKKSVLEEQEKLREEIQKLNSDIELLDQIKVALNDDDYFMKITPNDAFGLLKQIGYSKKDEILDVYMKLVSSNDLDKVASKQEATSTSDTKTMVDVQPPVEEEKQEETEPSVSVSDSDFSFEPFEPITNPMNLENESKEDNTANLEESVAPSKYQKYIDKIENPTGEMSPENMRLLDSCMQAINESVLSDSNSYFLGDITINKEKVMDNMKKLFTDKINANDVLPMLTVGMSYGTTSDESVMDEILDYLKALQVKAS